MSGRMKEKKIIDFRDASESGKWERINDAVMGGMSESSLTPADEMAVFEGIVSLENFGGFASVRSLPREFGLGGYDGLILRVRGDGRRYRLRLKTDDDYEGVSYQAVFFTDASEWTESRLSFDEFVPVFRGRLEIKEVRAYASERKEQ